MFEDLRMAARYQHLGPAYLADAVKQLDQVFPSLPYLEKTALPSIISQIGNSLAAYSFSLPRGSWFAGTAGGQSTTSAALFFGHFKVGELQAPLRPDVRLG